MARLRVRAQILEQVAMFMLEQGKILTKHEYDMFGPEVPLRSGLVMNHFGAWTRLITFIENDMPDVYKQLTAPTSPPPPPPPPPQPEEDPLAKLAGKPSVEEDEDE